MYVRIIFNLDHEHCNIPMTNFPTCKIIIVVVNVFNELLSNSFIMKHNFNRLEKVIINQHKRKNHSVVSETLKKLVHSKQRKIYQI